MPISRVEYFIQLPPDLGFVVGVAFIGDVNEATGIDDVVGSVEDATFGEEGAVRRCFQLVVGGAGDDGGPDFADGFVIHDRAHRTRGEYVDIGRVDRIGGDRRRTQSVDGALDAFRIQISHE